MNDEMSEYVESTGKSLNELLYTNLTRKQAIEWLTEYMQEWEMSYIIELLGEEVWHGELEQVEGMK
jgi:hypothetical protein|tara:strand:+ start:1267 stop:1464 length:198 start_codon:yes stop_codon:yes gene_type:complete